MTEATAASIEGAVVDPAARPPKLSRTEIAATIGIVFVATRILTALLAYLVEIFLSGHAPTSWDDRPVLASLTSFDAVYYLGIAQDGYHVNEVRPGFHDWAFFPGFPALVRVLDVVVGDLAIAGILVSNLALLVAMALLFVLGRRHVDDRKSLIAVVFLAIAPGAVAFGMAYGDSVFLAVAIGAFLAAERRAWPLMSLLLVAATLTRLPGVLLIIPLGLLVWQRSRSWADMAWLASGPVALAAFAIWQSSILGQPVPFLAAQADWTFAPGEIRGDLVVPFDPIVPLLTLVLLGHVFLLVYVRPDRLPKAYAAYAVVSLVTVLMTMRLLSVARYLAVVWPFLWLLANRPRYVTSTWPVVATGGFAVFAILHFSGAMAP